MQKRLAELQSQRKATEEFFANKSANHLVGMGFAPEDVKKAVAACGNDITQAIAYLIAR